jgi:cyclopropane-fatty-acyl-phospholipid synthase
MGDPQIGICLWDGQSIAPRSGAIRDQIQIRNRWTLWKLAWDPLYEFGEAYARGDLDVLGNLSELLTVIFRRLCETRGGGRRVDCMSRWLHRPRATSLGRSRDNIHHHYDIGNDFYGLWLDRNLVYTCAYFADPSWNLEQAQVAKMDHVCRKVGLRRGEHVVEAGCGWGALALHMARHYGVTVSAFNISHEQVKYARERAMREGLERRVAFIEDDWRNMNEPCDAFVSVGMLEHVGRRNYGHLGHVIDRCLGDTGRGIIHTIGQNWPRRLNPWIERRIFPGGDPPSLRDAMRIFEPYDFSVLDVENLRLHYAETLRHWLHRFERSQDAIRSMFDERFGRMWRLYLSGSIAGFESGSLQLFQIVFAPGASNDIPRTREALYQTQNAVPSSDEMRIETDIPTEPNTSPPPAQPKSETFKRPRHPR